MTKTLFKFLFRKIRKNLSGFITISLIVTLGVGFLIGLLICTTDLQNTMDQLYDSSNVPDITLKSTIGFNKETINAVEEIFPGELKYVEGSYQMDEKISYNDEKLAARVIYYNFDSEVNKLEILEGNIPTNENEILVERESAFYKKFNINDTLIYNEKEYIVTGIAANPQYFSNEKEFTIISPGKLDTIIYINNQFNTNDFYTDITLVFEESYEFNTFSEKYFNYINEKEKVLETNKTTLIEKRLEQIKETIKKEVETGIYDELVNRFGETIATELMKSEQVQNEIQTIIDEQIKNLEADVYILDRKDNTSFHMYEIQSKKTNEIAIVFPFFFIAIAALITLSTLERMIKEDRIHIGTLKSLGFRNRSIINVYVYYTLIATIAGVALGTVLGIFVLPFVIYVMFSVLYYLPPLVFGLDIVTFLVTTLGIVAAVIIATLFTLRSVLKEKPNALLTQKPIKSGGKILLERIKFIWNRLKFKYKSTIRNLFRFKKNALMMIVGVAGSTALVVTAFGMSNSISDVTERQYNDIVLYNTLVEVDDFEINPFENYNNIEKQDIIYNISGEATDDKDYEIEIIAPYKNTNLNDYINFIQYNKEIEFTENSIFISSQLSEMLGIQMDDVFFFNVDGKQYSVLVNGIVENHLNNYLYISEYTFKNIFKDRYEPNCYIGIANNIDTIAQQEEFIIKLSDQENVISVVLTYQNKQTYDTLLGTLQLVIVVLIVFAGLLEITSIYSLTNINVSERNRELATLKVLGYRRREIVGYVYRETTILAFIGTLFGFLIGFLFHRFVVSMMQMPGLAIGYVISPLSYLYGFLISLAFFAIVDLIFFPKINNISMTESLKSVE